MALVFPADPLPLPPDEYITLVSGESSADGRLWFTAIGEALATMLDEHGMLGDHVRLLDIGCGCGRVSRYLIDRKLASYVGFDRHRGMIEWCRREIAARHRNFAFEHFDIKSAYREYDGEAGTIAATEFRFPFGEDEFHSVLLASVFTHMPLPEISHYLREIYRVLHPCGKVLLSVFFSQDDEERVRDKYNFFVPQHRFLAAVTAAHFHPSFVNSAEGHHWYLLRPLPEAFDPGRYLTLHGDVAAAGMDPADHYLRYGRREGRRLR